MLSPENLAKRTRYYQRAVGAGIDPRLFPDDYFESEQVNAPTPEDIMAIARENHIVRQIWTSFEWGSLTWDEAIMLMVIQLHQQNKELTHRCLTLLNRVPPEPIKKNSPPIIE